MVYTWPAEGGDLGEGVAWGGGGMKPTARAWPTDGIEPVVGCPVCGSTDRKELYAGLTDRVFECAAGRWDLYQCKGCESGYLDPRPTVSTIHLAYENYYTHKIPVALPAERLSWPRRMLRSLANDYCNDRYGSNIEPAVPLGRYLLGLLPRHRKLIDRRMRHLPRTITGGRLLDVGFGSGAFLMHAKRAGWNVFGADPDPVSVKNGRNLKLDVRQGGIEAFLDSPGAFDVIMLSHVIEHIHDPVKTLNIAYGLLKPGGLLYVETPNMKAYGHDHFREHWRGLEIPRHLVIFNWASLTMTLKNVGFGEIRNLFMPSSYVKLAAKSRAIREGRNPNKFARATISDRLNGLRLNLPFLIDNDKTEFLAVYARKDEIA